MRSYVRLVGAFAVAGGVTFACNAYEEASPPEPTGDAGTGDTSTGVDSGEPEKQWIPREGSYRYRVDGHQELRVTNLEPVSRDEGPVVPAEIRREAGTDCWRFRICFVSGKCDDAPAGAYSEVSLSFCVESARLELRKAVERSRWLLVGQWYAAVSEMTCEPGQATYARTDLSVTSWSHVCQGSVDNKAAFASSGPYRYIGEETVMVGGTAVPARHFTEERDVVEGVDGAPDGTQIGEYWLAANGLPVRLRRGVNLVTDVPIGVATFTQSGKQPLPPDAGTIGMDDCMLDSLEPGALPTSDAGADAN